MKKRKRAHGMSRFIDEFAKLMWRHVCYHTTNNWRKMHGKPMRRKYK